MKARRVFGGAVASAAAAVVLASPALADKTIVRERPEGYLGGSTFNVYGHVNPGRYRVGPQKVAPDPVSAQEAIPLGLVPAPVFPSVDVGAFGDPVDESYYLRASVQATLAGHTVTQEIPFPRL